MRLLVVSQYFWPENFRINDLVAELAGRGHQVTVLTGVPNYPDGQVFDAFRRDPSHFNNYEGANVVRVPMLARGSRSLTLALNYLSFALSATFIGAWKLRKQPFDVIFVCQLSPVTVGVPGAFFRWLKKAPMAMWVLDLWPESLRSVGAVKSEFVLSMVERLVRAIYRRCDLILVQSKSFMPLIRKTAGTEKLLVEYLPSWAEGVFGAANKDAPAAEVPVCEGCFTVLFAGNLGVAQDFPAVLAAADSLRQRKDIRWVIVGDGRMGSWIRQEIERKGLNDTVHMVGRFPLERMPSFYACADVLLVTLKDGPIFSLTIPGKLQSYLASGIPTLAMLNGEGAEALNASGAGWAVPAGNSVALAEAVRRLAAMPKAERIGMGEKGIEFYRSEFERTGLISKLERRLSDLCGKRTI
jgi:glycosyltransferase involved in cell wall biosynthesis